MVAEPRGTPYRLGVVCLGNICRSPMAEVVLGDRLTRAGLGDRVEVDSCGTGDWHLGEPMHESSAAALEAAGLDPGSHRAQQVDSSWFDRDLLLAMDRGNLADLVILGTPAAADRIRMFRATEPDPADREADVPDPWGHGRQAYDETLAIITRCADGWVAALADTLGARPGA